MNSILLIRAIKYSPIKIKIKKGMPMNRKRALLMDPKSTAVICSNKIVIPISISDVNLVSICSKFFCKSKLLLVKDVDSELSRLV